IGPRHLAGLLLLGMLMVTLPRARAQSWPGHSHDSQHTGQAGIGSLVPESIRWQTPVDLAPQYSGGGGDLLTHYGSPLITSNNTVLVPVKLQAHGVFRLEAHSGCNGALLWTVNSDY